MSGGEFDYNQYRIKETRVKLNEIIESNDSNEDDGYGGIIGRHFSSDTIKLFKEGEKYLKIAEICTTRIDYLLSGDDDEDTFHTRVNEELNQVAHGDEQFKGKPTLDDYESVKYRMKAEGIDYCFMHYSNFKEIPDPTFHRLRKKYMESVNELTSYITNKIDEFDD